MKKLLISMVAAVGLISGSSFAGTNGFVAKIESAKSSKSVKAGMFMFAPTDITVINATPVSLTSTAPITATFGPSQHLHIQNYGSSSYTQVAVMDPYNNLVFNSTVCPHAIITIQGQPGSYRWDIDEEYCH